MSNPQFKTIDSSTPILDSKDIARLFPTALASGSREGREHLSIDETFTIESQQFLHRTEGSRTLSELQQHPQYGSIWRAPEPETPSALDVTRNHRLAILASEQEGEALTREDQARLAILTQRLRRLSPKVPSKAWTIAEEALAKLEKVSAKVDDIGLKYGL